MRLFTTRSGNVLHANLSCRGLEGHHVLSISEDDAMPHAIRCRGGLCVKKFAQQAERDGAREMVAA